MPVTAATNAIVTLTEVKEYMNLDDDDTSLDDFFQRHINNISSAVENYVRGKVKLQSITGEIYSGNGKSTLFVRWKPIVQVGTGESAALSDVQYRGDPTSDWQDLLLDVRNIIVDPNNPFQILLYNDIFPSGIMNIKVNYKAGYAPIPGDIWNLVIEAVAERWAESKHGGFRLGMNSKTNSQSSVSQTDSFFRLSREHKAILNQYVWYMP